MKARFVERTEHPQMALLVLIQLKQLTPEFDDKALHKAN